MSGRDSPPLRRLALVVVAALIVAFGATGSVAGAKTIWLCKPGDTPDPCTAGLSTTVFSRTFEPLRVTHPSAVAKPAFDCFYVYPTVSEQRTTLSNRQIGPAERTVARWQVARYSQYCRVYAPMYRQVTLAALTSGTLGSPAQLEQSVGDVTAAFKLYLRTYNHGRPFVLIGHSQGSFVLEQMVRTLIDPDRALRANLVSAVLLGGNVLVKDHSDAGGTFQHIPACRTILDLGCVIAFSTFDQPVPSDSLFGRTTAIGEHVLCVNPVALQGRSRDVDPILPSGTIAPGGLTGATIRRRGVSRPPATTAWWSLPDSFQARCSDAGGAHVLELRALPGAQLPKPFPDPTWGLHRLDANVELGNLVSVVEAQANNWLDLRFGR